MPRDLGCGIAAQARTRLWEPRGRVRIHLWGQGQASPAPPQPQRSGPQTQASPTCRTCVWAHTALWAVSSTCCTSASTSLGTATDIHVGTGPRLFAPCSKAGLFSLWMSSKDFPSVLQGGNSEFPARQHQPGDGQELSTARDIPVLRAVLNSSQKHKQEPLRVPGCAGFLSCL